MEIVMIRRMMVVITLALLVCLWTSGALVAAEQVRITHNQVFPPYAEVQEGKSVGLAVDIIRAAAARAGIDVVFVPLTIEQQMPALKDGRADATLSGISPERQQFLDFSAPVIATGAGLYVRAPSATPESLTALSGKVVVTPRAGPVAPFIQKTAPSVNLVVTADYEESLARLVEGRADAAALNLHVGNALAARLYPGKVTEPRNTFWEAPLAIGVPKGERANILAQMNVGLAAIRADGTWQQINNRWTAR
jgi:ABC-type amino acid transport substrate-binding protein